jgi:UDP-3-O-[3-hydroxymyristoyl] N-acetylglucosamine deacetylase / 3-hydroxyacyl-[acyl-carrier-protein] dehydratase
VTVNGGFRRTIGAPVTLSGIGLHLGRECTLTFLPAPAGAGVRFVRTDRPGLPSIPARVEHAVLTERRTQLGEGDDALHTVEHVLAAIAGAGLDDVVVQMDAPEPPIMDGSARAFHEALLAAGIVDLDSPADYLELSEVVRVSDGEATYEAHPAAALELDITIEFKHPLIGRQHGFYSVTAESFPQDLAPARTFGFVHEVERLRKMGLIRGASVENALVLDETEVVDNVLRWPDEFVRHKALDCVGDLVLAGRRIRARIVAHRPSHRGTVLLVREMLRRARPASHLEIQPVATEIGIEEIMRVLPHRYPFLLVDRIIELEEKKRVVGIKNVTINEPFFQGHFPGHPIMPGVLIVEAMAQVGGMLLLGAVPDAANKVVYFMSLDNVKFRKPVKPGDQLRFELDMTQIRGPVCKMRGVAKVEGEVVAEADMAAIVRDR